MMTGNTLRPSPTPFSSSFFCFIHGLHIVVVMIDVAQCCDGLGTTAVSYCGREASLFPSREFAILLCKVHYTPVSLE